MKEFIQNIPIFSKLSSILFFLKNVYKKREKTLKIWLLDVDGHLLLTLQLLFFSVFYIGKHFILLQGKAQMCESGVRVLTPRDNFRKIIPWSP